MNIEVSVVMPCLNEEETLAVCIKKIQDFFLKENISGEVIVSDNGSTDKSIEIAKENSARVVHAKEKGYGAALQEGINNALGKYVIMGDSDDSYDFSNLMPYIYELRKGNDLVMGNRFKGGIKKGAMPFLHKYLGNPVLSFIGRLFFNIKIKDFHCGLRGFSKESYDKMNLKTTGMEFASEMIVKASLKNMKIIEVPTTLSPDGRSRPPHLRTFRDGWRHLRFLLMFAPKWLFLIPGVITAGISSIFGTIIFINPLNIKGVVFDIHTLILLSFTFFLGIQFIFFHIFVNSFRVNSNIISASDRFYNFYKIFTLERGILLGFITCILGVILLIFNFFSWKETGFSSLESSVYVRKILGAVVPLILGIQIFFYSFMLSIISIKKK